MRELVESSRQVPGDDGTGERVGADGCRQRDQGDHPAWAGDLSAGEQGPLPPTCRGVQTRRALPSPPCAWLSLCTPSTAPSPPPRLPSAALQGTGTGWDAQPGVVW